MSKFEFNRKIYDAVKKMDRTQMEQWAKNIYESGYESGKASVEPEAAVPDPVSLENDLQKVNGIGPVKAKKIIEVIKNRLAGGK